MTEQIQNILRREGISASQLAEKIGVQRSSISHILSERNKPSLDFIQKLIEAFPHISSEWIISGKGSYSKQKQTPEALQTPLFELDLVPITELKTKPLPTPKPEPPTPSYATSNSLFSEIKRGTNKKAIRVITFYEDNTFDEYFPN